MVRPGGWLVIAALALQGAVMTWIVAGERPPAVVDLRQLPQQLGSWKNVINDRIDAETVSILRADGLLSRTYYQPSTLRSANLFIAWYQSQRGGTTQPHSPSVCLPGNGWAPERTTIVTIPTAAGPLPATEMIIANRGRRAVVLYWYQTCLRPVAGEWAARFWLIADAARRRRTDQSLVRVVYWSAPGADASAERQAAEFAATLYPELLRTLPR